MSNENCGGTYWHVVPHGCVWCTARHAAFRLGHVGLVHAYRREVGGLLAWACRPPADDLRRSRELKVELSMAPWVLVARVLPPSSRNGSVRLIGTGATFLSFPTDDAAVLADALLEGRSPPPGLRVERL